MDRFSPSLPALLILVQSRSRDVCVVCVLLMAGADREEVSEVSEVVGCSTVRWRQLLSASVLSGKAGSLLHSDLFH